MKILIGFLLSIMLSFSVWGSDLTLQAVEARMVRGGYLDTLYAAYWAADQGEAVVPILEEMLNQSSKYHKEPFAGTSAFPFNVIWALAHIDSGHSLKVLVEFSRSATDRFNQDLVQLAIKGFQLRRSKQSKVYGVLVNAEARLLGRPSARGKLLKRLKSGQSVRILNSYLLNKNEEGPRSGPAIFDYVEIIPERTRGYVQRLGGDFTPFI